MMDAVVLAQLETIVDSASKLGQAGLVVILLFFVIVLGWALRGMFSSHEANTRATITAIIENTKATEAHTRALEANERAAQANQQAISQLKMLLEMFIHKGSGTGT